MNPIRNLNFTHGVSSYQIGLHISFRLFFVFLLLHANDVVRFFCYICHHAIVERGRFAFHKVSFFVWSLVEKLALLVHKSQSDIRYDSITVEYLQLFHILFCLLNLTLTSCNRPSPEAAAFGATHFFRAPNRSSLIPSKGLRRGCRANRSPF